MKLLFIKIEDIETGKIGESCSVNGTIPKLFSKNLTKSQIYSD